MERHIAGQAQAVKRKVSTSLEVMREAASPSTGKERGEDA
jgi:hypothetical protein